MRLICSFVSRVPKIDKGFAVRSGPSLLFVGWFALIKPPTVHEKVGRRTNGKKLDEGKAFSSFFSLH